MLLIKDGQRYSKHQLRIDNPNTSFPEEPSTQLLKDYNVFEVDLIARPPHNELTEKLVESFSDASGTWEQVWTVERKSDAEILAELPWQNASEARAAVVEWIDEMTAQIEEKYPWAVQQRWPDEEAAARAVKAGNATSDQADMITGEGAARGRVAADHAAKIIVNADRYRAIANEINKLFLATVDKIEAAQSPLEYPAIFDWAKQEAAPLMKAYGLE